MQKITVKGTWLEMGRAAGQAQQYDIKSVFRKVKIPQSCSRLVSQQTNYLKQVAPQEFLYLQGMSEWSGQSLKFLIPLVSWEAFLSYGEHCSTILGSNKDGWFIAHNEDDSALLWKNRLWQVRHMPKHGPWFEGIQYPGQLPGAAVGVNAQGFAIAMNSLWRPGAKPDIGWPISFIGTRFLQSRSWKEVLQTYRCVTANRGMHFFIVEKSHRAMSCEFFSDAKARQMIKPGFYHANHPLITKLKNGAGQSLSSRIRMERLAKLDPHSLEEITRCLRCSMKQGGVKQVPSKQDDTATLATFLVFPEKRKIELI
ncbi:hypothetical protein EXS71_02700 [Candidatus Uhrbacteria bacterium]|nr:hypothetical protein [Candidatus Uhrbacteria bacterium]